LFWLGGAWTPRANPAWVWRAASAKCVRWSWRWPARNRQRSLAPQASWPLMTSSASTRATQLRRRA
jgi:hypothetical protein